MKNNNFLSNFLLQFGDGGGGGSQSSGGGGQGGGDGGSSSVLATMGWVFKAMMEWLLNIFEKIVRVIIK